MTTCIERLEGSYRITTDKIAEARGCKKVDDYTLHYLKHMRGGWFALMDM